jgi:hypothetical protein
MKECIDLERQGRGCGISRCDLFRAENAILGEHMRTRPEVLGCFWRRLFPQWRINQSNRIRYISSPAVQKQWLSFGLGVLVLGACTQTPQIAYHVPVPPAPKTSQVLSNPQGARIAVNQEYLGEVIKFPAETESGNYTLEETLLGFGNAIVKAITGQQSNEDPHQPH